uniref:MULE transposase domain-containing protein n=1 Tax=Globisporangium ultimum (strain ATCC 200006 / CBS 805.95 / DAOM BR144) TaxID=431595 RepID=K3X8J8_GLOUD
MFHVDVTFKLSGIGYPVIICSFTNRKRSYQLTALFAVSQRTKHEYAQCVRSLARITKEVCGKLLKLDAIMGDTENAEFSALDIKACHLRTEDRKTIMPSIMDIHFCESVHEVFDCRDHELWK